jgi:phosphatidylglycerophosphate synthase
VNGADLACSHFLILADDSADWKIAGLRLLERLVLALNEFAESVSPDHKIDIVVFWNPKISVAAQWVPPDSAHARVRVNDRSVMREPDARVLDTHLFVGRNGLAEIVAHAPRLGSESTIVDESDLWNRLALSTREALGRVCAAERNSRVCRYMIESGEIARCERRFLRDTGKSHDGIVARFLNRPISRSVTRILLKTRITPNAWSVGTTIIPLIGCLFLVRGTYWGFVLGTACYHFHSALDGCDGEIARAKYLESERGRRVDAYCDLGVTVLMALSLGVGLYRQRSHGNVTGLVFLLEGVLSALLITLQLWISDRRNVSFGRLSRGALGAVETKTGSFVASQKSIFAGVRWLLIEATKRDVAQFFFLVLAIAGAASWILQILSTYALIGFVLTLIALRFSNRSPRLSGEPSN